MANKKVKEKKKKKFVCSVCNQKFARKYNVKLHKKTQYSKKIEKLICPYCSQHYSTKENLQVHLKKHHGNKKIKNKYVAKTLQKWS